MRSFIKDIDIFIIVIIGKRNISYKFISYDVYFIQIFLHDKLINFHNYIEFHTKYIYL